MLASDIDNHMEQQEVDFCIADTQIDIITDEKDLIDSQNDSSMMNDKLRDNDYNTAENSIVDKETSNCLGDQSHIKHTVVDYCIADTQAAPDADNEEEEEEEEMKKSNGAVVVEGVDVVDTLIGGDSFSDASGKQLVDEAEVDYCIADTQAAPDANKEEEDGLGEESDGAAVVEGGDVVDALIVDGGPSDAMEGKQLVDGAEVDYYIADTQAAPDANNDESNNVVDSSLQRRQCDDHIAVSASTSYADAVDFCIADTQPPVSPSTMLDLSPPGSVAKECSGGKSENDISTEPPSQFTSATKPTPPLVSSSVTGRPTSSTSAAISVDTKEDGSGDGGEVSEEKSVKHTLILSSVKQIEEPTQLDVDGDSSIEALNNNSLFNEQHADETTKWLSPRGKGNNYVKGTSALPLGVPIAANTPQDNASSNLFCTERIADKSIDELIAMQEQINTLIKTKQSGSKPHTNDSSAQKTTTNNNLGEKSLSLNDSAAVSALMHLKDNNDGSDNDGTESIDELVDTDDEVNKPTEKVYNKLKKNEAATSHRRKYDTFHRIVENSSAQKWTSPTSIATIDKPTEDYNTVASSGSKGSGRKHFRRKFGNQSSAQKLPLQYSPNPQNDVSNDQKKDNDFDFEASDDGNDNDGNDGNDNDGNHSNGNHSDKNDSDIERVVDEKTHEKSKTSFESLKGKASTDSDGTCNNSHEDNDIDGILMNASIPKVFLHKIPVVWAEVWHILEDVAGWTWTKGRGLVNFFYLKPNTKALKPFILGKDYFDSEDAVMQYVTTMIEHMKRKFNNNPVTIINKSGAFISKNMEEIKKSVEEKDHHVASSISFNKPLKKIPWKDLWRLLRSKGWHWDFGPGHINYIFSPGYNIKSKDAIPGIHRFENEEEVRRYINQQNWPEFNMTTTKEFNNDKNIQSSMIFSQAYCVESQQQQADYAVDAHLKDPNWKLAANRKRRASSKLLIVNKKELNEEDDDEEEENHRNQKMKYSKKRQQGVNSISASKRQKTVESLITSSSSNKSSSSVKKASIDSHQKKSNSSSKSRADRNNISSRSNSRSSNVHIKGDTLLGLSPSSRNIRPRYNHEEYDLTQPQQLNITSISQASINKHHNGSHMKEPHVKGTHVKGSHVLGSHVKQQQKIFSLYRFVVSGCHEELKIKIISLIIKHGGTILETIPFNEEDDDDTITIDNSASKRILLISHPLGFRRMNYMMAVTRGIPLIHYQWIEDCIYNHHDYLYNIDEYQLPSGYSILHSTFIFHKLSSKYYDLIHSNPTKHQHQHQHQPQQNEILSNIKIINLAGNQWDNIILAMNGSLISIDDVTLQRMLLQPDQSNHLPDHLPVADLILIDPYEYANSCVNKSINRNIHNKSIQKPKRKCTSTSTSRISAVELNFIEYLRRTDGRQQGMMVNTIVTTDWLYHCIIIGKLLPIQLYSELFSLPLQPIKYPTTYKIENGKNQERYSLKDLVYYEIEPSNTSLMIGQIISFIRRTADSSVFVKLRPIVVSSAACKDQKSMILKEISFDHQDDDAAAADDDNEIIINSSQLRGKIVLLSKIMYQTVSKYSFTEQSVYCASESWIRDNPPVLIQDDREVTGDVAEDTDEDNDENHYEMKVQMSQDF